MHCFAIQGASTPEIFPAKAKIQEDRINVSEDIVKPEVVTKTDFFEDLAAKTDSQKTQILIMLTIAFAIARQYPALMFSKSGNNFAPDASRVM